MSNDKQHNKGYKVGYKKPPVHTRFGQPGGNKQNNKGRPPGRNVLEFDRLSEEALWSCFLDSAQKGVTVREEGSELVVPLIMALAKQMAREAMSGDRHARKEYLRFVEKATKGQDQIVMDMASLMSGYRERNLKALQNPGSYDCYAAYYAWYMVRKDLRLLDGADAYPYEDGEPVTKADWLVFLKHFEHLKNYPCETLPWPPEYPV